MNVYEMNKQALIDNKIALPIMWASTANIKDDNDVEMDAYIDCTETLTLMVLKCPIGIGFDFVMVIDPDKPYTQRTGWMVMSDVEAWNTEHQYCEECDCILRWDESETLCKSCEERIEKENLNDSNEDY